MHTKRMMLPPHTERIKQPMNYYFLLHVEPLLKIHLNYPLIDFHKLIIVQLM
jgi:hypothetical protein